ncbi:putative bifunctional diguanylate cyclase/phosphodiesterase [Bryobacter aggregatus]|uniref:putative bifunctional diguanylate cyclase/phosphodiesterase n=1 Tax=Bryobacter aggregatus TaxID=360054 RepID=UPI000689B189|nr:GGDEF and EAL domain-containing protein [Bryobacter aggregatus]
MCADLNKLYLTATPFDIPDPPMILIGFDREQRSLWQTQLRRIQDYLFTAEDASEAQVILSECEKLGTPVGLIVLVGLGWEGAACQSVQRIRRWHPDTELPIVVACVAWERQELLEAMQCGVSATFSMPWDWEQSELQIRQELSRARRCWTLKTERDHAVAQLAQLQHAKANQDLWRLDLATRTIEFSSACSDLIGFHPREMGTGLDDWLGLVHPSDLQRLSESLSDTDWSAAPEDLTFEFRLRHRTGSWRWVLMRGRLELDESGQPGSVIGSHTDITQAKTTDSITGMANRFYFEDWLQGHLATESPVCVFLAGIDRYELIRDSLGQSLSDQLLRLTGERLDEIKEQYGDGLVARLSGDEFGVAIAGGFDEQAAIAFAEELRQSLSRGIWLDGKQLVMSTSVGFVLRGDRSSYAEVWRDAEIAMHSAKAAGGNRVVSFDHTMRANVIERMEFENDLKRAIEVWEFEIYYQPKVTLNGEKIIGFEALLRWRHPAKGIVPPSCFIPLAEETGLILPIGMRTVREACATIRRWQQEFPQDPQLEVSVNLSVRQFQDRNLIDEIRTILAETEIPPATLQFEVTESVLVDDPDQALAIVEQLRRIGVGLKIDDFGTGYSSLSYLHRLPFDTVKIDRSFICTMGQDHTAYEIVRAIISLAQSLGLQVIAEGVETRAQAEALRDLGCGYAQGYLFAPPLTQEAARRMLVVQASLVRRAP